ncbi:MAG TPA: type I glyceraldehyde-3-phosphate dehydrogenase [Euryarchaeota archaeon]|nr:type I glyceraldehyde-3-phosphate dehydrogenase [Euryarchaeota archaeon]
MTVKIGINGFGRTGRLAMRAAEMTEGVEVVMVNTRSGDAKQIAYLYKYDSVHGIVFGEVIGQEGKMLVNGRDVALSSEGDLSRIPWKEYGVEVVLECTGKFKTGPSVKGHLDAGAKKVIIGAPGKDVDGTFVIGVNENTYEPKNHHIVSNASCTTNCLAPVAKIINDELGIRKGFCTTIHAYTSDQRILDGSHKKDFRRARAAAMSMIPTSTGAAKATGLVIPELKGKLDGIAVRVPTPNVSIVDLVATVERETTKDELNGFFEKASQGTMKGILGYNELPLVSVDYTTTSESSIIDGLSTNVIQDMVKIFAWYDNEAGYAHRLVDFALLMKEKGL